MFYVDILKCSDNSCYTGQTDDLEKRINEHEYGIHQNAYTYSRRPLKLVYQQSFETRIEAKEAEKKIKGWGRLKKVYLIRGDWGKSGVKNPSILEDSDSG